MLRNKEDLGRCSYFELGLPVVEYEVMSSIRTSLVAWPDRLYPIYLQNGENNTIISSENERKAERAETVVVDQTKYRENKVSL